ncbi:MAG: prepilin-type N-terminal cleavage/methylation domain-containing protein [Phycisphaerales bacterium]
MADGGKKAGFTLLELLVVVAVIAMMLAISLPVLSKVRRIAKRATCGSNLRQIALAYDMYIDDHEGRFLGRLNGNYDYGGWHTSAFDTLSRPLNGYLRIPVQGAQESQARVFRCPGDQGGEDGAGPTCQATGNSYQASPVLVNLELLPAAAWFPDPWRSIHELMHEQAGVLRRENVSQPSRQLWIGDYHWVDQWDPSWTWACGPAWHGAHHRYNMVFLDGHIQHIKIVKGLYLTDEYRMQPFGQIDRRVKESQKEADCACGRQ